MLAKGRAKDEASRWDKWIEVCLSSLEVVDEASMGYKTIATKALATPEQTATGKEISNPLIADSLLKTIRLSMHLVITMKH
ncbi:hypothetical protein Tco_0907455 [Tanacetum coccineum]|uniref:Uncharacterized protein n=1 Tax=Tanacetum coccineum TaxID=301880 RepID=A0ABQ5CJE1_9ASTR